MRCEATIWTSRTPGGVHTRQHLALCPHPARYRAMGEHGTILLCGKHARSRRWDRPGIEWQTVSM